MPSAEITRLVILDSNTLFYRAVRAALGRAFDGRIVHAHDQTSALQSLYASPAPVLIGSSWPPPHALRLCRALRLTAPDNRVVIVTAAADEPLFQTDAAYSGASACLAAAADTKTIAEALRQVERGATLYALDILRAAHQLPNPTPRELELLRALAQDKTDREIADELCLSEHTVGVHLRNVFRKLEAHDRKEAVRRARHRGWV